MASHSGTWGCVLTVVVVVSLHLFVTSPCGSATESIQIHIGLYIKAATKSKVSYDSSSLSAVPSRRFHAFCKLYAPLSSSLLVLLSSFSVVVLTVVVVVVVVECTMCRTYLVGRKVAKKRDQSSSEPVSERSPDQHIECVFEPAEMHPDWSSSQLAAEKTEATRKKRETNALVILH